MECTPRDLPVPQFFKEVAANEQEKDRQFEPEILRFSVANGRLDKNRGSWKINKADDIFVLRIPKVVELNDFAL